MFKKILPTLLLLPTFLLAQGFNSIQINQASGFLTSFNQKIIAVIGVILMSLAIVTFFAGVVRFIWSVREGDSKAAEQGRRFILWGILAIFSIFSIYGLIYFIQQTTGTGGRTNIAKPCLDFVTDCKNNAVPYTPTVGGGGSVETQTEVIDDCISRKLPSGSSCTLTNGASGVCSLLAGVVICQSSNVSSDVAEKNACAGQSESSLCSFRDSDRRTITGVCLYSVGEKYLTCGQSSGQGVTLPSDVQNQDCLGEYTTCFAINGDGSTSKGVCTSSGSGSFYCKTAKDTLTENDATKCFGKKEWDTCSYNGDTGLCFASESGGIKGQLYCDIGVSDTVIKLSAGSGCIVGSNTRRCGPLLSCQFDHKTGGNDLYTCQ